MTTPLERAIRALNDDLVRQIHSADKPQTLSYETALRAALIRSSKNIAGTGVSLSKLEQIVAAARAPLVEALKMIASLDAHSGASLRDRAASEIARRALSDPTGEAQPQEKP